MDLNTLLEREVGLSLHRILISGKKSQEGPSKIRIRPVQLKGELYFQCQETRGTKEFHKNLKKEELIEQIMGWMAQDFKQLQLESANGMGTVLVSKKGKVTVKWKACMNGTGQTLEALSHNRKKKYILEEGKPVAFLCDLGVMTQEGRIVHAKYDKFRQINRFLEFIEDILPQLDRDRELTILDFGCGKSYLTFAMYYYLHELKGYDIRIVGLDLKEDVIRHCGNLAEKYGYDKLSFLVGDIADYEGVDQVDMVVTLHACDTATDYALAKAVGWNAKVILSVPCCQHELNAQLSPAGGAAGTAGKRESTRGCPAAEILAPVMDYGLLRERFAALVTDGLRAKYLESMGYETQVLEFIDMEHTPKNILLRAVKKYEIGESRADAGKKRTEEKPAKRLKIL